MRLRPRTSARLEPFAREMFHRAAQGRRPLARPPPCLPDMRSDHRAVPAEAGLWLDFGHQHLGLTLGPITGRLLAEMMTGETPSSTRAVPGGAVRIGLGPNPVVPAGCRALAVNRGHLRSQKDPRRAPAEFRFAAETPSRLR